MNSPRIRRASNTTEKEMSISKAGQEWMVSCLDPFHDYQQTLSGYPDMEAGRSVCQMYTTSYNIAMPSSYTTGYNCQVVFTGLDAMANTTGAGTQHMYYFDSGKQQMTYSSTTAGSGAYKLTTAPVMVLCSTGTTAPTLDNVATTGTGGTNPVHYASLYTRSVATRGRLIGIGIEVHNTTAELYKQGTVTVGQLASDYGTAYSVYTVDSDAAYESIPVTYCKGATLPSSEASLRAIPGSGQWEAAKGVYMIPRLLRSELPIMSPGHCACACFSEGAKHFGQVPMIGADVTTPQFNVQGLPISSFSPMSAIFTGLSPQTTLRVTVRSIVEFFPGDGDAFLPLAIPSALYDPLALTAYAAASRSAPYAVPVSMNAAGDYFRLVLKALSGAKQISPLLALVPKVGPLLSVGAAAIGTGAQAAYEALEKKKKIKADVKPEKKQAPKKVRRDVAGSAASATR